MAKRRYRVSQNDTYLSIAGQFGMNPSDVAGANPGVSTLSPGTYINVPRVDRGLSSATSLQAQMPNQSSIAPPQAPTMGSPAQAPTISTGDNTVDYAFRQKNNAASAPPPMGFQNQDVVAARETLTVGEFNFVVSGIGNGISNYVSGDVYNAMNRGTYGSAPIPTMDLNAYLQGEGFTQQPDGSWYRGSGSAYVEPKNLGGWQQYSDGSWHLNRNASQEREMQGNVQSKSKSAGSRQGSPVNWSL